MKEELERHGYLVLKEVFNKHEVAEIDSRLKQSYTNFKVDDFFYSLLTFDAQKNLDISTYITDCFRKKLANIFQSYKYITGSFLIKPANQQAELALHQDWSYTFETEAPAYTCWSPLVDTDQQSGGFFLLPGSHLFFQNIHSHSYQTARIALKEMEREEITFLKLNKGDVLIFDPRIWHGSSPNLQNSLRTVFTCLMIPQTSSLYYFHRLNEEECLPYLLPDNGFELYLCDLARGVIPTVLTSGKKFNYKHEPLNAALLLEKNKSFSKC